MNRSRSLSTKRRKPDSVSSQDSSSSEGRKSTSDNQKKRAKTTSDPPITIRDHFGKAAAADKLNMSSAASDRHVVDNVSDPVSSETCEEGEPEPSNRDIMRLLMAMNKELNKKLDCLSETVERLQGEVFDLKQENTRLSAELDRCRKKEEDMQTQIKEAMFNAKLAAERADRNEQYSRRNNVKLLYVPEAAGSFESAEESERKALQVFHNRLDLKHITPEHIEAAHRVGVKRAGSTRPILVKFLSRKTMQQVIQKRRKLKHTEPKVVIVEDLTKSNYNLFLCASDHPGASRAWTSSGKVFVQDTDSKIYKIEKLSDLQRLPCDAASLATSTPAGATAAQQRHNRQPMTRRGLRPNKRRNIFDGPSSQEMEIQQTTGDATPAKASGKE